MQEMQKALEGVPQKSYYRIGEVARITGVKPYVLRYWETEFKTMAPPKSRSQQRMYRRRDIETILSIKHLLYEKRFTIEGARKRLTELARETGSAHRAGASGEGPGILRGLRSELLELRRRLEES